MVLPPNQLLHLGPDPAGASWNHFDLGLGLTSHINYPQAQLGNSPPQGAPWFYSKTDVDGKDVVVFSAPLGGATTSTNTQYARCELREYERDGTTKAAWDPKTGDHWIEGIYRIYGLAGLQKPEITVSQAHDASDDTIMVSTYQGGLRLRYNGTQVAVLDSTVADGDPFYLKIRVNAGTPSVYYSANPAVIPTTPTHTSSGFFSSASSGWYFKTGAYNQTNESTDPNVNPDASILRVEVRELKHWHSVTPAGGAWPTPASYTQTGGTTPVVDAGADSQILPSGTFSRTASTTLNGATLTSQQWKIVSGPAGAGNVLSSTAAVSWVPGAASTGGGVPVGQTEVFKETFDSGLSNNNYSAVQTHTYEGSPSGYNLNSEYRMQIVNDPSSATVLRTEVRDGDTAVGSHERCELSSFGKFWNDNEGNERWYEFDIKFETMPSMSGDDWMIIYQWHNVSLGDAPPLAMALHADGKVYFEREPDSDFEFIPIWTPTANTWYHVVAHIKWSPNPSTGFIQCHVNGTEVVTKRSCRTQYTGDTSNQYVKFGQYRRSSISGTSVVKHDNLRVSTLPAVTSGSTGGYPNGTYVLQYAAVTSAGTFTDDVTVTVTPTPTDPGTGGGGGGGTPGGSVGTYPTSVAVGPTAISNGSTTVTVLPPTGMANGQFQICIIQLDGVETIPTYPTGWSLLDEQDVPNTTSPSKAFILQNTTGHAATLTLTKSGSGGYHAVRMAWRDWSALGQHTSRGSSDTLTPYATTVTPGTDKALVVTVMGSDRTDTGAGPVSVPTGWTSRYNSGQTVNTNQVEWIAVAELQVDNKTATGANLPSGTGVGTSNFTLTNSDNCSMFSFVLEGAITTGISFAGAASLVAKPKITINLLPPTAKVQLSALATLLAWSMVRGAVTLIINKTLSLTAVLYPRGTLVIFTNLSVSGAGTNLFQFGGLKLPIVARLWASSLPYRKPVLRTDYKYPPINHPFRLIAQRILDGEIVEWELPVGDDFEYVEQLSGPVVMRGSFRPEIISVQELNLDGYAYWLHVEINQQIRASAILLPPQYEESAMTFSAEGISAAPHYHIYDNVFQQIQVDPLSVVRTLWNYVQSQPQSDLGVIVSGLSSPVRLGEVARTETTTTTTGSNQPAEKIQAAQLILDRINSGQQYFEDWTWAGAPAIVGVWNDPLLIEYGGTDVFGPGGKAFLSNLISNYDAGTTTTTTRDIPAKPYELVWWNATNCGEEIDTLAGQTPFDYLERHEWNSNKTDVLHYFDIGYPRIGVQRPNLLFNEENILEVVPIQENEDSYASAVLVIGAGEGADTIRGYTAQSFGDRVRKEVVITDKTITTQERANARALMELAIRRGRAFEISEIVVNAYHPNAPIGSYRVGDDIRISVDIPWLMETHTAWYRITSVSNKPSSDKVRIGVSHASAFDYTEEITVVPPDAYIPFEPPVPGTTTYPSNVSLSILTSINVGAVLIPAIIGAVDLLVGKAISVGAVATRFGSVSMSAPAVLTASGIATNPNSSSVSLIVNKTITAGGTRIVLGAVALSSAATLTADVFATRPGAVSMTVGKTLTVGGIVTAPTAGTVTLISNKTLTVGSASVTRPATATRKEFLLTSGANTLKMGYWSNGDLSTTYSNVTDLVFVIHGDNRDADNYITYGMDSAAQAGRDNRGDVLVVAPHFIADVDPGVSTNTDWIYWSDSGWKEGNLSQSDTYARPFRVSSFAALDSMLLKAQSSFSNLARIRIIGHSAGAQYINRYAASSSTIDSLTGIDVRFIVANPSSYLYLDNIRPHAPGGGLPGTTTTPTFSVLTSGEVSACPGYDTYKYGLAAGLNSYVAASTLSAIRTRYQTRKVTYLAGSQDIADIGGLDTTCEANWQGAYRLHRSANFFAYLALFYGSAPASHTRAVVAGVAHDAAAMITSAEARAAMFFSSLTGAVSMAATPVLSPNGVRVQSGAVAMTSTSTLVTNASVPNVAVSLNVGKTLTVGGTLGAFGAVALTVGKTLTVNGTVSAGTTTSLLGKDTDGTGTSASTANKTVVSTHTAGVTGTVTAGHARLWVDTGTASVQMVVYADSSGAPGALLGLSDALTVSNTTEALKDFTFSGAQQASITNGTTYWIGFTWADPGTNSVNWSRDTTAGAAQQNSAVAANPFGTPGTALSGPIDAYVEVVSSGGGGGGGGSLTGPGSTSPALKTAADLTTATTATFDVPANSVVVAIVGVNHYGTTTYTGETWTLSNNGAASTWTQAVKRSNQDRAAAAAGMAIYTTPVATARTGMTVTASVTAAAGTADTVILAVYVIPGADLTTPVGGVSGGFGTTNVLTTTGVTMSKAGSLLFVGAIDYSAAGVPTSSDLTTTGHTGTIASNISYITGWKLGAASGATSTANLDGAGSTNVNWTWVAAEIRSSSTTGGFGSTPFGSDSFGSGQ